MPARKAQAHSKGAGAKPLAYGRSAYGLKGRRSWIVANANRLGISATTQYAGAQSVHDDHFAVCPLDPRRCTFQRVTAAAPRGRASAGVSRSRRSTKGGFHTVINGERTRAGRNERAWIDDERSRSEDDLDPAPLSRTRAVRREAVPSTTPSVTA